MVSWRLLGPPDTKKFPCLSIIYRIRSSIPWWRISNHTALEPWPLVCHNLPPIFSCSKTKPSYLQEPNDMCLICHNQKSQDCSMLLLGLQSVWILSKPQRNRSLTFPIWSLIHLLKSMIYKWTCYVVSCQRQDSKKSPFIPQIISLD